MIAALLYDWSVKLSALLIIAQSGYQDRELDSTRKGLEEAGFNIVLASSAVGTCRGKFGGSEEASIALCDVQVEDYDRIAFIGGPGAAELALDHHALRVAQNAVKAEKPLGAICIAPTILAAAGVLAGKRATVWDNGGVQADVLRTSGAEYTGDPVTIDGRIITGNGPEAAEKFGRELALLR
jgi:protease I